MKKVNSVSNLASEADLQEALCAVPPDSDSSSDDDDSHDDFNRAELLAHQMDWTIKHLGTDFKQNTLAHEFQRLQVLQSYMAVGHLGDDALDILTRMASRVFKVQTVLVSLVDLGRLWFISGHGQGDLVQIPRKESICSYCILSKAEKLVIPDASKDERFKELCIVTEGGTRFYAGATLMAPEGFKLGNFCLLDNKPKPEGLSEEEMVILQEFAQLAVKALVDRRYRKIMSQKREQMIAQTSHDLMTPLSGLQVSMNLLKEDESLNAKLDAEERELLHIASSCADVMTTICQSTVDALRAEAKPDYKIGDSAEDHKKECKVSEIVDNVRHVIHPIPKKVPIIISVEESTPDSVICHDVSIFRSILNFLVVACDRTVNGSIHFRVRFDNVHSHLVFECEDTAPAIFEDDVPKIFQKDIDRTALKDSSLMGFNFAARLVRESGGKVGYKPRSESSESMSSKNRNEGSIFWFSFPISLVPDEKNRLGESMTLIHPFSADNQRLSMPTTNVDTDKLIDSLCETSRHNSENDVEATSILLDIALPRKKKALVIDDSAVVRKTLARSLTKNGFEVQMAEDGMEGLEALKADLYDICLCDFLMPRMDGMDCIAQFRVWEKQHRPYFRQHVVGISAHASPRDTSLGLEAGMDDFLPKPVTPKHLTALTEKKAVIENSKQLDELRKFDESGNTFVTEEEEYTSSSPSSHAQRRNSKEKIPDRQGRSVLRRRSSSELSAVSCLSLDYEVRQMVSLYIGPENNSPPAFLRQFKENGWVAETVDSCSEGLRLMKLRNWDAVIFDDEFAATDIRKTLDEFRDWESHNRVNLQKNIILRSDPDLSAPELMVYGLFDGVLLKPSTWPDFQCLLTKRSRRQSGTGNMTIVIR